MCKLSPLHTTLDIFSTRAKLEVTNKKKSERERRKLFRFFFLVTFFYVLGKIFSSFKSVIPTTTPLITPSSLFSACGNLITEKPQDVKVSCLDYVRFDGMGRKRGICFIGDESFGGKNCFICSELGFEQGQGKIPRFDFFS